MLPVLFHYRPFSYILQLQNPSSSIFFIREFLFGIKMMLSAPKPFPQAMHRHEKRPGSFEPGRMVY